MPHTDYMINDAAVAYWQRQKLAQAVVERLTAGCAVVRGRGGLAGVPGLAGGDQRAARADRHRRGVAGESDRSWGVAGVGGPQRWGRAVRRLGACGLLAPRGAAVGATDPVQREAPGGHRADAAADLGVVRGPEGVSAGAVATARDALAKQFDALVASGPAFRPSTACSRGWRRIERRCCGCWSGRRCRCTTT